jgi:quinol monooxygenase YgiN
MNTYILIERWTDPEAAMDHLRSQRMTRLLEALSEIVPEKFTATRLTRLE